MKCEALLSMSTDWRLHSAMLGQLETYVKVSPSDLVFSHVPVILFHRIQDSVSIFSEFYHRDMLTCLMISELEF